MFQELTTGIKEQFTKMHEATLSNTQHMEKLNKVGFDEIVFHLQLGNINSLSETSIFLSELV